MLAPYSHSDIRSNKNFTLPYPDMLLVQFILHARVLCSISHSDESLMAFCRVGENAKQEFQEFVQGLFRCWSECS